MEAASNNGIFPLLTTRLDGGFGPHPHQAWLTTQAISTTMSRLKVWQCADAVLREKQNPETVITRPQLPSLPFEPLLLSLFFFFGSPAFLNSMRVFKWGFVHSCMFADGFLNHFPIILSYSMWKTFNLNPEVSQSCAGIKAILSAQCCFLPRKKRRVEDPV